MEEYEAIVKLERMSIQEAKLSYVERQNFPDDVFCGPNKTFPANDMLTIRESLKKIKNNKELDSEMKYQIEERLRAKADRFESPNADIFNDEALKKWFRESGLE